MRGDGSFLHPDSFTHAFKSFEREAGLHPSTRLHDVRHAVATELGRQGSAWRDRLRSPRPRVAGVHRRGLPARVAEGPNEAAAALEKALGSNVSGVGNPLARAASWPVNESQSIANWLVTSVGRQGIEP